jgi:uncharacterized SAM-binding protein YcdF (DUF218 family)
MAIGVLTLVITLTPAVPWSGRVLAGRWNDPTANTLIVLGGSFLDPGIMGESSYWRSVYGLRAYQEGGFEQVIVSGGASAVAGASPVAVADLMADFLVCHGVPSSVIKIERRSRNTRENALYSAQILRDIPGTKVLLTSDYHMFRARRAFEKAGVIVRPRPFPDVIKRGSTIQGRLSAFVDLARESAAVMYYFARGWI